MIDVLVRNSGCLCCRATFVASGMTFESIKYQMYVLIGPMRPMERSRCLMIEGRIRKDPTMSIRWARLGSGKVSI